jgi:hypothetical protein
MRDFNNPACASKQGSLSVRRDGGEWSCPRGCGCPPGECCGPLPLRTVASLEVNRGGVVEVRRASSADRFRLSDIRAAIEGAINAPLCRCCRCAPNGLSLRQFESGTCRSESVILALALVGVTTLETGAQEWAWAEVDDD